MSETFKMQPVRGVRDIFGSDVFAYKAVLNHAYLMADLYNYQEIMTPIFEFSEVFHRTLGETSDVVSKETYTFLDRDKTSITLRPEFTAGIVRSIISNGLTQSLPIKYFSHGPVFRHERPQKARYRQFHQIDFESIGVSHPYADIEIIALAHNLLLGLGLKDIKLEISSLGDIESRMAYKEHLVNYLNRYASELSEDSKIRLEKNPLRILDSKDENDRKILSQAPQIYDSFTKEAQERFEAVKLGLTDLGIEITVNPKIVRGLDYYTHTVFEFTTDKLGSQSAIIAGGRYDKLFETMGAPSTPAIGFGLGIERVIILISNILKHTKHKLIWLVPIGENALKHAPQIAEKLRAKNLNVDYVYHSNVGKQMQKADKVGATHTLIFGEDELKSDTFKLKDMKSGEEKPIRLEEIYLV